MIGEKERTHDQVNFRLPADLNDWLNAAVRKTKRASGAKIPKELIIEETLDWLMNQPIDFHQIKTRNDLKNILKTARCLTDKAHQSKFIEGDGI